MTGKLIERTQDPQFRAGDSRCAGPGASTGAAAARMANVALTAQVQFAYSCAAATGSSAARAADYIEAAWPDTPLRALVVAAYRAQLRKSEEAARGILQHARRRCGLAFARIGA